MAKLLHISTALIIVAGAACGSDDDAGVASPEPAAPEQPASSDAATGSDATEGADGSDGSASAPSVEIDAASMPPPGDVRFEVEGSTYDFAAVDAAQGPAYSCSVGSGQIVVELQLSPGALVVQANNPDGETWFGSVTISPADTDRIYFSEPGFDGTFAVDGTMAQYEGDFFWRTSDDPGRREDAGTGIVRMNC